MTRKMKYIHKTVGGYEYGHEVFISYTHCMLQGRDLIQHTPQRPDVTETHSDGKKHHFDFTDRVITLVKIIERMRV